MKTYTTKRGLLYLVLLLTLTGFASVAGATYTLPAARSVTWVGNVGIAGDIPVMSTVYTTLSPSGSDDTAAIQTAVNNCPAGQVVKLNSGTFKISSPISLKSSIALRGAGIGKTILQGQAGASGNNLLALGTGYWLSGAKDLTSGFSKASTTITTSTAHGWSAGDIILIDQLNSDAADPPVSSTGEDGNCGWCGRTGRSLGQMVKITSVPNSTTATLEIPLYWNFNATLAPQASKTNSGINGAGVESLTIDNSLSGTSAQGGSGTVVMRGAANCWAYQVEMIGAYEAGLRMWGGNYRNVIRACRIHEGIPSTPTTGVHYGSGRAYGIYLGWAGSANLIEDNELYHLSIGFVSNGAVSGNVISYNYVHDIYYSLSGWNRWGVDFHGAHPVMNLIEGNYVVGVTGADDTWGTSSHNSYFRNKTACQSATNMSRWNFSLYNSQRYYNLVGNVLGTVGEEIIYELTATNYDLSNRAVYQIGYYGLNGSNTNSDPAVKATLVRHGNWDSVNNAVSWNGADDQVLPASLYLSSKPSWWGTLPWPCVGPDLSPMHPALPTSGGGTPWDKSATAPVQLSPPSNLRVQ
jgi:hypothetical protein